MFDLISNGRIEFGLGSGGTPSAFSGFGRGSADRAAIFDRNAAFVRDALAGKPLGGGNSSTRRRRISSIASGRQLFRRPEAAGWRSRRWPHAVADLQRPIIDAYLAALPYGREPRIMASRTLFVADDRKEALRLADIGLGRVVDHLVAVGFVAPGRSVLELIAALDMHVGTPEDMIASLRADSTLDRVTDLVFQVHSVDPPRAHILRSIELIAERVAPALGWGGVESTKEELRRPRDLA